jgi:hypothetical protein
MFSKLIFFVLIQLAASTFLFPQNQDKEIARIQGEQNFKNKYGEKWSFSWDTNNNVIKKISGSYLLENQISNKKHAEETALNFLSTVQDLIKLQVSDFRTSNVDYDSYLQRYKIGFMQEHDGVEVYGARLTILIKQNGEIYGLRNNSFFSINIANEPSISQSTAIEAIKRQNEYNYLQKEEPNIKLVILPPNEYYHSNTSRLAYQIIYDQYTFFVDATSGQIIFTIDNYIKNKEEKFDKNLVDANNLIANNTALMNKNKSMNSSMISKLLEQVHYTGLIRGATIPLADPNGNTIFQPIEGVYVNTYDDLYPWTWGDDGQTISDGSYDIFDEENRTKFKVRLESDKIKVIDDEGDENNLGPVFEHQYSYTSGETIHNYDFPNLPGEQANVYYNILEQNKWFLSTYPGVYLPNLDAIANHSFGIGSTTNGDCNGERVRYTSETGRFSHTIRHEYSHFLVYNVNGESWLTPTTPYNYVGDDLQCMDEAFAWYFPASAMNDSKVKNPPSGEFDLSSSLKVQDYNPIVKVNGLVTSEGDGILNENDHANYFNQKAVAAAWWTLRGSLGQSEMNSLLYEALDNINSNNVTPRDFFNELLTSDDDDYNPYNLTPHFELINQAYIDHGMNYYPKLLSTNGAEIEKNVFSIDEDVYVRLYNCPTNQDVRVYVVYHQDDWANGAVLEDITGLGYKEVTTDVDGNYPDIFLWTITSSTFAGKYDIIVDVDNNGLYDWDFDGKIDARDDFNVFGNLIELGLNWLRTQQNQTTGSWYGYDEVGTTALILQAFLAQGYSPQNDITVQKGIDYLLLQVQSNGGIYNWDAAAGYQCAMAITTLRSAAKYNPPNINAINTAILNAQQYFVNYQSSAGGWRYSPHSNPEAYDLSVSQWVIFALDGIDNSTLWNKVLTFLHDHTRDPNSGGYFYNDYENSTVTGTMTCAGIWGEIIAGGPESNVDAAFDWLVSQYVNAEGIIDAFDNTDRTYYYIYSFAKACALSNKSQLAGENWYEILSDKLFSKLNSNHWNNTSSSWETELLSTALAILSLEVGTVPPDSRFIIRLESPVMAGMDDLPSDIYLNVYDGRGHFAGKNESGNWVTDIPNSQWNSTSGTYELEIGLTAAGSFTTEIRNDGSTPGDFVLNLEAYQGTNPDPLSSVPFIGSVEPQQSVGTTANVNAIGGLNIYAPQPTILLPKITISPNPWTINLIENNLTYPIEFTISENDNLFSFEDVDVSASDLLDEFGHIIPASSFSFNTSHFDLISAGSSTTLQVTLTTPGTNIVDLSDAGVFQGTITLHNFEQTETINITAKAAATIVPSTSTVPDFRKVVVNSNSVYKTYKLNGANLSSDIIITAPTGFSISFYPNVGPYSQLSVSPVDGIVKDTTIYVWFSPTIAQSYSDNIILNSTGAINKTVSVTGTGIVSFTQFTWQTGMNLTNVSRGSMDWGDYDNDGDLDLFITGQNSSSVYISELYNNNNNNFTPSGISFIGVGAGAKWGDYNNDGRLDIVLSGNTGSGYTTLIYKNTGSNTFTPILTIDGYGVDDSDEGSIEWIDFNNDGNHDLLISGSTGTQRQTRLYKNDSNDIFTLSQSFSSSVFSISGAIDNNNTLDLFLGGTTPKILYNNGNNTFTEQTINLPPITIGSGDLGDYDQDGDLDIVYVGYHPTYGISSGVYRNDGNNNFNVVFPNFFALALCDNVYWSDIDNDGDLDFILSGSNRVNLYKNEGFNIFVESHIVPSIFIYSALGVSDYDNDGDLDFSLSGGNTSLDYSTRIYKNNEVNNNPLPTAPTIHTPEVNQDEVTLSWDKSTDYQTPQPALTYNLVIGTSPDGENILSPMSDRTSGTRKVINLGNTNHNTSWKVKGLESGLYYWSVQAIDNTFAGSPFASESYFQISSNLSVNVKLFLDGCYSNGSMTTTLNTGQNIPKSQPYNSAPWNYTKVETVPSIPAGVVDWVLLELRTGTTANTMIARRAAFLKSDGSLVDLDGVSQVDFFSVSAGNYYLVIYHRNHLPIMTANPVELTGSPTLYDLSGSLSQAYTTGQPPMKDLGGGKFGMFSGDASKDGQIDADDRAATWNERNQVGYLEEDVTMDGQVDADDRATTWNNRNVVSQVPTPVTSLSTKKEININNQIKETKK